MLSRIKMPKITEFNDNRVVLKKPAKTRLGYFYVRRYGHNFGAIDPIPFPTA